MAPYIHLRLHAVSFTEFLLSQIFTGREPDPVASGGLLTNEQVISVTAIRTGGISYYLPPCDLHKSTPSWLSYTVLTLNRQITP